MVKHFDGRLEEGIALHCTAPQHLGGFLLPESNGLRARRITNNCKVQNPSEPRKRRPAGALKATWVRVQYEEHIITLFS